MDTSPATNLLSQSMEVVYPSGLISHEIVGSNPTSATKCASGGMVYTMVLEAIAERIESSSLSLRTNGDVAQR